jgi:hypothetical protein
MHKNFPGCYSQISFIVILRHYFPLIKNISPKKFPLATAVTKPLRACGFISAAPGLPCGLHRGCPGTNGAWGLPSRVPYWCYAHVPSRAGLDDRLGRGLPVSVLP